VRNNPASIFEEILILFTTSQERETIADVNKHASRSRFKGIFNFFLDDEYPEVQERSDFRYSRKGKIENYLNMQARYMRSFAVCGTKTRKTFTNKVKYMYDQYTKRRSL